MAATLKDRSNIHDDNLEQNTLCKNLFIYVPVWNFLTHLLYNAEYTDICNNFSDYLFLCGNEVCSIALRNSINYKHLKSNCWGKSSSLRRLKEEEEKGERNLGS